MLERLDYTTNKKSREEWQQLLTQAGLREDPPYTAVFGLYEEDRLIATGARDGMRIKCVAVHPDYHGGAVFHTLLSGIITDALDDGIRRLFLYTTPGAAHAFAHLGFRTLAQTRDGVCFMERGTPAIDDYLDSIREQTEAYDAVHGTGSGPVESIVMNANPFTKGHRALVENALTRANRLHLFILSEDASAVPADIRFRLVKEGTADLPGIIYHPTDSYIISRASFPSYFVKKESEATETQARLDAVLFRGRIAPALGITNRTVGDEPHDIVTAIYNRCLGEEFKGSLILTMMPRIKAPDGEVISASRVRQLLTEGKTEEIEPLVPGTTLRYFLSTEGKQLVRTWNS